MHKIVISFCTKLHQVDPEENPFLSAEEDVDELVELETAVERLQSREHDESLMRLAKDSGKEIYSHLNSGQRRARITSMVRSVFERAVWRTAQNH